MTNTMPAFPVPSPNGTNLLGMTFSDYLMTRHVYLLTVSSVATIGDTSNVVAFAQSIYHVGDLFMQVRGSGDHSTPALPSPNAVSSNLGLQLRDLMALEAFTGLVQSLQVLYPVSDEDAITAIEFCYDVADLSLAQR